MAIGEFAFIAGIRTLRAHAKRRPPSETPAVHVVVRRGRSTQPILAYVRARVSIGANVTGVADPQLETIRVVAGF